MDRFQQRGEQVGAGQPDDADPQRDTAAQRAKTGGKAAQRKGGAQRDPAQQHKDKEGDGQADDRGEQIGHQDDRGGGDDLVAVDADDRPGQREQPQQQKRDKAGQQKIKQHRKAQAVGVKLQHPALGDDRRRRGEAVAIDIGVAVGVGAQVGRVDRFFGVSCHKIPPGKNKR